MFQDIDPDILEAVNLVENEYQEFFKKKLEEYGVKSPNELGYEKAQEFFNDVKKNWKSTNESEEVEEENEELNEGIEDVYASTYNQLVNPYTLGVGDVVSFPYSGYNTEFKIELIVNPMCFGMPTIYHMKALNGPCEGQEMAFEESFVQKSLEESEIQEDEDELDRVVEAVENDEQFTSIEEDEEEIEVNDDNIEDDEEIEVNDEEDSDEEEIEIVDDEEDSDELDEEESEEQKSLNEATDFDVTKLDDKKLENILKIFLKAKAVDGEDYEIVSKGNKLILKVYNNKYVQNVQKEVKGE